MLLLSTSGCRDSGLNMWVLLRGGGAKTRALDAILHGARTLYMTIVCLLIACNVLAHLLD